jgi:hypothetical protein
MTTKKQRDRQSKVVRIKGVLIDLKTGKLTGPAKSNPSGKKTQQETVKH